MTMPTPEEAKRLLEGVEEARRRVRGMFIQGLPPGAVVPPAPPTVITGPVSTGPCPKCRDRGWVFTDILQGTTKPCACTEVF